MKNLLASSACGSRPGMRVVGGGADPGVHRAVSQPSSRSSSNHCLVQLKVACSAGRLQGFAI